MSQTSRSCIDEIVPEGERSTNVRAGEEVDQGAQAQGLTAEQDALLRNLVYILQRVPTVTHVPAPVPRKNPIIEVRKMGAKDFNGIGGVEPNVAEYWLEDIARRMEYAKCSDTEKYSCAVAFLQGEAFRWWKPIAESVPAARLTWEFFQREFRKKFIGKHYLNAMRKDFMNLRQGSLSVREYEAEFNRLMRYAPEMVSTMEDKCERFLDGLRHDLHTALVPLGIDNLRDMSDRAQAVEQSKKRSREERTESKWQGKRPSGQSSFESAKKSKSVLPSQTLSAPLSPKSVSDFRQRQLSAVSVASTGGFARSSSQQPCQYCLRNHGEECWRKTRACIRCGSKDHFIRNCSIAARFAPATTQRSALVQSGGRGYNRGNQLGGRGAKSVASGSGRGGAKIEAHIYSVMARKDAENIDVVTGLGDQEEGFLD